MNTRLSAAIDTATQCYRHTGGDADADAERSNIAAFVHSAVATLVAKLHDKPPRGNPGDHMWVPVNKLIDEDVYTSDAGAPTSDSLNLKTLKRCALAGLVIERVVEVRAENTRHARVRLHGTDG